MSPSPRRDTAPGRAYNDLRNLTRRQGRDAAEYFSLYALEGFVARLAVSRYADHLVLKGGVLLAAFSARRPTRDIDLAASGFPNEITEAEECVRSIAALDFEDGLDFDASSVRGEEIRDESDYHGVRVHVVARLATARIPFHVDLNFGDPSWPAPMRTGLPRLLGGEIDVLAYPVTMVLAEKIIIALERGTANTRWRDFVDIASLATGTDLSGDVMMQSLTAVADHRQVGLAPLATMLDGMVDGAQRKWEVWRRKQRLEPATPEDFQVLLDACSDFADPALRQEVAGLRWSSTSRRWV
ncbi:nucleotidyl transferase AbiEii/AbiGii toxin family protein [Raineyella sp. W15-4]|uniref:nucleotidyl transferase AbiEii/AbiGii toxin family protein n=1 Tax=Raineyella sp. W15-4 TaxID=3081651 RepID=UPI002952D8D2|nr:nucleotidyl transferase AbiEii/AbiGii toxin family protein [Raineyella sp. W15-4]WOQ18107.1 nucleotidyl transferase AbiEii/AbiGii toxin family protein [Raineyella sp. W15-4]